MTQLIRFQTLISVWANYVYLKQVKFQKSLRLTFDPWTPYLGSIPKDLRLFPVSKGVHMRRRTRNNTCGSSQRRAMAHASGTLKSLRSKDITLLYVFDHFTCLVFIHVLARCENVWYLFYLYTRRLFITCDTGLRTATVVVDGPKMLNK